MVEIDLTHDQAKIIYRALLCHDGPSLRPEWSQDEQEKLTRALDRLRVDLLDLEETEGER